MLRESYITENENPKKVPPAEHAAELDAARFSGLVLSWGRCVQLITEDHILGGFLDC